jgi:hypothetical protein
MIILRDTVLRMGSHTHRTNRAINQTSLAAVCSDVLARQYPVDGVAIESIITVSRIFNLVHMKHSAF